MPNVRITINDNEGAVKKQIPPHYLFWFVQQDSYLFSII